MAAVPSDKDSAIALNRRLPEGGWHQAIIAAWDGLIYSCAADYRVLFMNRRFRDFLGRDAIGEFCYQALHSRSAPCPWCPREAFEGQSVSGFFQKLGESGWYHVVNVPTPLEDGSYAKVAFIRESPEPVSLVRDLPVFRNIVDCLSDIICFHAPENGKILYANDLACTSFGCDRQEILGKTPWDCASVSGSPRSWKRMVRTIGDRQAVVFESHYRNASGKRVDLEVKATRVRAGLEDFVVTVARDITERKRTEARLIEERNKLDAIIDATGDGITVQDLDFRIIYQNEVLINRRGNRLGERCYRVYADRDEACEECQAQKSLADGQVHTRDFVTTTPEGAPLYLEISACPLRDAAGKTTACVEVVRDVTEQKKLEMSREEAFSAVSHEMRTPLTAVLGFTQYLLENATTPEQQREYLDLVAREGKRLKRLIDNLLSLHRLRAGFGLANSAPVMLYPLLHEVTEHYRTPLVSQRIEVDCRPDLPPVAGEAVKLYEAVTNLLDNAVKYSPAGGAIVVGAALIGPRARVWVRDQGEGVPREKQELVFERFYRVQGNCQPGGTGLGLALVREIAQAHGGRAWVESVPGTGSTFYLELPLANTGPARLP